MEGINKYTSNCLKNREFMYIARPSDNNGLKVVIMPITKEQEEELDNNKILHINSFVIKPDLCYAYGNIDLSPDSDILDKIVNAKWFDNVYVNQFMLSEYDYKTHTVTSDKKGGRWYETDNPKIYLPYLYACINKPERIVIFKDIESTFANKVNKHKSVNSNKEDKEEKRAKMRIKLSEIRRNKVANMKFTIKK